MKRYLTVLIVLATIAGLAYAQPPERPRRMFQEELNLTQEQQDQMQKLRSDFQKKRIQDQARVRTARIELRDILSADNPDRKAVESKVKEIAALQQQAEMNRIDHQLAVRAMLTPEQRKVWKGHMLTAPGRQPLHRRGFRGPMRGGPMEPVPAPEPGDKE